MTFELYPAIDMRGGKCVRLLQGNYDKETVYGDSPFDMAKTFVEQGANWIHMVDLDGAKAGKRVNDAYPIQVAKELGARVQIGGGIREEADIEYYLNNGVYRVIIGSLAVSQPELVLKWVEQYKERIVIGLDAKDGFVATHGWIETSSVKAVDIGKEYANAGVQNIIFTDIATDGTLAGPNVAANVELAEATGVNVIASGGVSSLADLRQLASYTSKGVAGAIMGKSLYENRFTVKEALAEVQNYAR